MNEIDLTDETVAVRVTSIGVEPGCSIGYGWGDRLDTGASVRFAGDWRPMLDMLQALARGEEVIADAPGWTLGWGG